MAFITKIAEYIEKNYELSKDSLIVIFPNKRAALTLRKELAVRYNKNVWLPQILSIQEAFSSWSKIQLIDNIDIIYEMISIMNSSFDISSRDNMFGLASQIVKDFDEIDQYNVDADKLFNYLEAAKKIETWSLDPEASITEFEYLKFFKSLSSYYHLLKNNLLKNNVGYYGMITRKLCDLSNSELENTIGKHKIIFAGFNAMTSTEENIIVRLVELGKAVLLWDLDKYYFDDEIQEAGLFARNFFLKHKNISRNPIEDNFNNIPKKINIIGVSGSSVQTCALQIQLENELHNKKDNSSEKKAIVLSDENLLIPTLNSIPKKYNNIQVTMGYPYSKTIVNQFIQHLFLLQNRISKDDEKVYFWTLKRILETELVKIIFDDEEQRNLIEFIDYYVSEYTYYLRFDECENYFKDKKQERLYKFIKEITKKWESSSDCISRLKYILKLLCEFISVSENNYFIKNQISVAGRIINKLDKLIDRYNDLIKINDIESLYKQSALELSIRMENETTTDNSDNVLSIMGLLETRNLDFDIIHILSVNEGVLPQSKTTNTLIPFDIRLEYGLPVYSNKQAVYAYHFYRLIQNAKIVNIYYNNLSDGMGEGEPSRFIRQILHEMPKKVKNTDIKEIIYRTPSPKVSNVINIEIHKNEIIIDKIKKRLSGVNKYGNKKGLSPTSISCYIKCPLAFYLKYIENVNDNTPDETIQSNTIGNIIHSTFEYLYSKFDKGIIDSQYYELIKNTYLNEAYQNALINNKFKNGLPEAGFNYLTQIMIKELLDNFIEYEKNFLKVNKEISIIGLEQNLSYTFSIDGFEVNLTGFADRIDKVRDNKIRIMDYKTGVLDNTDVTIKKTVNTLSDLTEKSLQLVIYKYLYLKNNPNVDIKNIEPGIFGLLKINKPFYPLVNNSDCFDDNNFIDNCDNMFMSLFSEILNPNIPFYQVNDENKCNNCEFTSICKRNPKKFYQ